MKNRKTLVYLTLLAGLLTYVLFRYHDAQPPGQAQIERCNELAEQMSANTREEINRSINTFLECLND